MYYLLGLTVFYFAYWTLSSQQARFLLVLLPILSLFVGYFLQLIRENFLQSEKCSNNIIVLKTAGAAITSIMLLAVIVNTWDTVQVFKKEGYVDYFSGKVSKDEYLENKLTYYKIYQYINSNLSKDAYIFAVMTGNQGYYLERNSFSDSVFEGHTFKRIITESASAQEIKEKLRNRKFTHILIQPKFFFNRQVIDFGQNAEKKLNDLFDNHLRLLIAEKSYLLFEISQT